MGLRTKLFALVAGMTLGIVAVSLVAGIGMQRLVGLEDDLHNKALQPIERTLLVHRQLFKLRGDVYKLLVMPGDAEKIGGDLAESRVRIDSLFQILGKDSASMDDSAAQALAGLRSSWGEYAASVDEILGKARSGDVDFGKASLKSGRAHLARKQVDAASAQLLRLVEAKGVELDQEAGVEAARATQGFLLIVLLVVLVGVAGGVLLARSILRPLREMTEIVGRLGQGDLRLRPQEPIGRDEIGQMQSQLYQVVERLRGILGGIRGDSDTMSKDARAQAEASLRLSDISNQNEAAAQAVTESSLEASLTLRRIAEGSGQTVQNVNTVSAALEEMSSSIGEISRSAGQTRRMSKAAADGADAAARNMQELARASHEIGGVIEAIVEISEQTKLLALNATIEAARAGEAGKGFAVVAGEVKELAKAAAEATGSIRQRVDSIRHSSQQASEGIATVNASVQELDASFDAIASAVEEQSAVTQEITRSVVQALEGSKEVNDNLAQANRQVETIHQDAARIQEKGRELLAIASQVDGQAKDLSSLSMRLGKEMATFRLDS
jgi:methyl-accepting chemotaxis protein